MEKNINKIYDEKSIYIYCKNFEKMGIKIPIICFPKTASSFIQHVINRAIGIHSTPEMVNPNYKLCLDERMILQNYELDGARHMHIAGQQGHIDLLNKYNIKSILLVRNIYDVLISIQDHIKNIGFMTEGPYLPKSYSKLNDAEQKELLIDIVLPWLMHFYISWIDNQSDVQLLILKYEDMLENKTYFFQQIFNSYSIDIHKEKIEEAITNIEKNKKIINFNKGIAGRGNTLFSTEQKQKIQNYINKLNIDSSYII